MILSNISPNFSPPIIFLDGSLISLLATASLIPELILLLAD